MKLPLPLPLTKLKLSGALVNGQWSLHACPLDHVCRRAGAPWRLYVGTPWGALVVALRPGDGVQLWLPWKTTGPFGEKSNYSRWWSPVAWQPARRSQCVERDEKRRR